MRRVTFYPQTQRPEDVMNRVMFPFKTAENRAVKVAQNAEVRDVWELQRHGQNDFCPGTSVVGPLFRNPLDALPDELRPTDVSSETWNLVRLLTPWHDAGVGQWLEASERFCDAYVALGARAPNYLVQDCEWGVWLLSHNWQVPMAYWVMKERDPRWFEQVVVHGKTMEQLCRGVPNPDPSQGWGSTANRPWASKVFWIYQAAMARAMKRCIYKPFWDRWPSCRCTNYQTDIQAREMRWHSIPWLTWDARCFGNASSPVLYTVSPDMIVHYGFDPDDPADHLAALLAHQAYVVDRCQPSGNKGCIPWVDAPGEDHNTGRTPKPPRTVEFYNEQCEDLQSRRCEMVIVWGWEDADWHLA